MSGRILNIRRDKILNALQAGDRKGFVLFPEIRDRYNINRIKQNPATFHMLEELLQYAENLDHSAGPDLIFSNFIEFLTSGKRLNYEKKYFESKKQLHALVMAEIIKGDGRFIETIQNRLWKWCDTYSWELPAHVPLAPEAVETANGAGTDTTVALFSAETAFYFSEILSLIGSRLNPLLVFRLRREIGRRVVGPFLERTYEWERVSNNWASVCAGAIGCTAVYSITDTDLLGDILLRVTDAMEYFLSGFDGDGVTTEGLTYWSYGFSFFVYFSELLKERTCGEIDLLRCHAKLRRIAELPLYLHFPDGNMINFSDAPGFRWKGAYELQCRLSGIFGIKGYIMPKDLSIFQDHTSKWAITSRCLFWGLDQGVSESHDRDQNTAHTPEQSKNGQKADHIAEHCKKGMFFFPESQWLIDRRLLPDFAAFAAKGGNNGESHNHNDLGHFILYNGGDILFADLGAPEYTRKYFGTERYDILHASSKGHSVPVINGKEQSPGLSHAAQVTCCIEIEGIVQFGLDLTGAYDIDELIRFHRCFKWDYKNGILQMIDEFSFRKPGNTIEETFISLSEPVTAGPGKLQVHGKNCSASLTHDASAKTDIICERFTDHFGFPAEAYRTVIRYDTEASELKTGFVIRIK